MPRLHADVADLNQDIITKTFLNVEVKAQNLGGTKIQIYGKKINHIRSTDDGHAWEEQFVRYDRIAISHDFVDGERSAWIAIYSDRAAVGRAVSGEVI